MTAPTGSRAPLSVVVSQDRDRGRAAALSWAALADQLGPADEVVWVDRSGSLPPAAAPGGPTLVVVRAPADASRGRCNALGVAAATHDHVGLTDACTAVQDGWADATADALTRHHAVGGPVLPSPEKNVRDWAGFLADYAPHAVTPFTSATGDVSGNNVAYRRSSLDATGELGDEMWKDRVDAALAAAGRGPALVPLMRVTSLRTYGWKDLVVTRFRSGRSYASHRAAPWGTGRRIAAALACLGLPQLTRLRTWRLVRQDQYLAAGWRRARPALLLTQVCWAAGEAAGYLTRRGTTRDVW